MRKHGYFIFAICLGDIILFTSSIQVRCFLTSLDMYVDIYPQQRDILMYFESGHILAQWEYRTLSQLFASRDRFVSSVCA